MKKIFLQIAAVLIFCSTEAQNLLPANASDFESGMPGKDVFKAMWADKDYKIVPGVGINGSNALEMTLTKKTKRLLIHPANDGFKAGSTVTATIWIKGDKAGGPVLLYLWGTNKFWEQNYQAFTYFNVTTEWKQYKLTRKLPKDLKYLGIMVAGGTAKGVEKVYIDNISLTSDTPTVKRTPAAKAAKPAVRKPSATAKTSKNLLPSAVSGFEGTLPGHPIAIPMWGNDALRITSDYSYCGAKSLEFTITPGTKRVIFFPEKESFKAGETVTASAYIRGDKAGGPVLLYLWGTDKLWNPALIQKFSFSNVSQEWKHFSVTAKLTKDINKLGVMVAAATTKGTEKLYIDEVKLERGSSATPSIQNRIENINALDRKNTLVIPLSLNGKPQKELAVSKFYLTGADKPQPAPQPTVMYLSADKKYLYFRFRCTEEHPEKINCKSTYDNPNWNDDRVELHLSMAGSKLRPGKGYFSINADGIYSTYYDVRREELQISSSRGKNYWEVAFRIPFREFGFEANQGNLWRISAGRFHRTGKHATSALAPVKGHFNRIDEAFKNFILSADGKLPGIILSNPGDMAEYANITGGNVLTFDFPGKVKADQWILKINGKKTELFEAAGNQLTYLYQIKGITRERLTYQLTGKDGNIAASGTFNPEIFNPSSRVYPTKDPLFQELLGEKRKTPRQHMTWGMLFDASNYHHALKTGIAYSPEQIYRDLKKAQVRLMIHNAAEVWENLPELRKGNYYRPGSLKSTGLTDYARMFKEGKILPTAWYSFYGIAGEDGNKNKGVVWRKNGYGGMPLDPINRNAYLALAKGVAERSKEGSVGIYFFGDELTTITTTRGLEMNKPFNKNSTNYLEKWNADVKAKDGNGKYGIPWDMDKKSPDYKPSLLAYRTYMARELAELGKETRKLVLQINPSLIMLSDDAYGNPSAHGVQYWKHYADWGTFQLGEGGGTSGKGFPTYMFTAKLVRDMSGLDELMVCPHEAVDGYPSGAMSAEEIVEAFSQCIRGGATGFHLWPAAYTGTSRVKGNAAANVIGHPVAYKYMLYYAELLNRMPNLKFPDTKTAVLVVDDTISFSAKFNRLRGAFSLVGLNHNGWFHYVSDTHVMNNWADLQKYPVCYIPAGEILRKELVDKLEQYVRNGGTLICADPEFGKFNQFYELQKGIPERLFGVSLIPMKKSAVNWDKTTFSPDGNMQKLMPVAGTKGTVLANYSDGSIAGFERKLGKGKTIFFGFDMFLPENAKNEKLGKEFTALYQKLGEKTGHDIWRFKLPHPELPEATLPGTKCLTGNYGFWNRNYFHAGRLQNIRIPAKIRIERDSKTPETSDLTRSKLTDRLSYFENTATFDRKDGDKFTEIFHAGIHKVELSFAKPVNATGLRIFCNGTASVKMELESSGKWLPVAETTVDAGKNEVHSATLKGNMTGKKFRIILNVPAGKKLTFAELDLWGDIVK